MQIIIGSLNETKIHAVKAVFTEAHIEGRKVPSGVADQPFSDEETRRGAINRAKACTMNDSYGIGLEGGVQYIGKDLYLNNWGALVTPDGQVFTASGARVKLPLELANGLQDGAELGDLMDGFASRKNVSHKEGAVGVFTNDLVSRAKMFAHVVKLLKGQLEYSQRGLRKDI